MRLAAGVIVLRGERVLMVCPTYKDHWDVPGGHVEEGESPLAACHREVMEELGVEAGPLALASVDWAPNEDGDRLLFLFAAPSLAAVDAAELRFPDGELSEARFVRVAEVASFTIPGLARRLTSTARTLAASSVPAYLEHGDTPG